MVEQIMIRENHKPYWQSQKTDPDRWPTLVQTLRKPLLGSLIRAGLIIIFLLVTISPTLIGRSVQRRLSPFLSSTAAEFENSKGNLLPGPVRVSGQTDTLLQQISRAMTLPEGKYEEPDTAGKECWVLAAITSRNFFYQFPQNENGKDSTGLQRPLPTARLEANQVEALRKLEADADPRQAATEEDLQIETEHRRSCLGERNMDYSDRRVAKAEKLSWKRVEPVRPRDSQPASVSALQLSKGVIRGLTRNPWESVRPRSDGPKDLKKTRSLKSISHYFRVRQRRIVACALADKQEPRAALDQIEAKYGGPVQGHQPGSLGPRVPSNSDNKKYRNERSISGLAAFAPTKVPFGIACLTWREINSGPRQTQDRPTWRRIEARQWTSETISPCAWQVEGESMPAWETKATNLDFLCQTRPVTGLGSVSANCSGQKGSEVKPEGPWRTLARPAKQQIDARKGSEVRPEAGPRQTLDRPTWQQIDARPCTRKQSFLAHGKWRASPTSLGDHGHQPRPSQANQVRDQITASRNHPAAVARERNCRI